MENASSKNEGPKKKKTVTYEFDAPGSKIKRSVAFTPEFDAELQRHVTDEQDVARLSAHAVVPTFTDVVTILLREGLRARHEWIKTKMAEHARETLEAKRAAGFGGEIIAPKRKG